MTNHTLSPISIDKIKKLNESILSNTIPALSREFNYISHLDLIDEMAKDGNLPVDFDYRYNIKRKETEEVADSNIFEETYEGSTNQFQIESDIHIAIYLNVYELSPLVDNVEKYVALFGCKILYADILGSDNNSLKKYYNKEYLSFKKMDLYDPLLYQLLRQQGDRIAHLAYINPNEELPDEKKAVEGERAIREKFPELEPLFMLGLKKVHTLESWLYDMSQKRVNNLKRKVKTFYASNEGKEFVKIFYEQDFMVTARARSKRKEIVQKEALNDLAPEIISWVLGQDIVKRRDADFLLRAMGAGFICADECDRRIKRAMGYWGTIANSISEAARINYVTENGLLENPANVKDVYYPMLREFCDNRGVYSGRNLSTTLYAMYGLGKLMRTKNESILSFLLNYQYIIPGRWIVNNYKKLVDTTDEIFERKGSDFSDIRAQTSPIYCIRALEKDQDLRNRFTSYVGTSRERVMSDNSIGMILKRFIMLEKDRYREHFTVRDNTNYFSKK